MKLTLVHPTIGRKAGEKYIKTWQMEPLPPALIAALTPREVEVAFYDDRMEDIPFDEATDLVAISVETYTAKRAYQIASEYRLRGVPVVMGGFHATLCPEEVSQYADAVVIGEAENIWEQVLADAQRGTLSAVYQDSGRPSMRRSTPDRSIYAGKRYLPIGLIEAARGCQFPCEFCVIQTAYQRTQNWRPLDSLTAELETLRHKPLIFVVDDNISSDMDHAKEFLRSLIPLNIRWVSQMSINAAHDEEFLDLLAASGCQGVLIGFESLHPENLRSMNKGFNLMKGGFESALANLRRRRIRLYITFVFGYDHDTPESFAETVAYAMANKFYIVAFNHLTPFPGTPLYARLEQEKRLLFRKWWLDEDYRYNMIPFQPAHMSPEQLQRGCLESRQDYYSWASIWRRGIDAVNARDGRMWAAYFWINYLIRKEVAQRDFYPLGDEAWRKDLIKVRQQPLILPQS